jgi:hypothetical protein
LRTPAKKTAAGRIRSGGSGDEGLSEFRLFQELCIVFYMGQASEGDGKVQSLSGMNGQRPVGFGIVIFLAEKAPAELKGVNLAAALVVAFGVEPDITVSGDGTADNGDTFLQNCVVSPHDRLGQPDRAPFKEEGLVGTEKRLFQFVAVILDRDHQTVVGLRDGT